MTLLRYSGFPRQRPASKLPSTIGWSATFFKRSTNFAAATKRPREKDWVRISVPINLRQADDDRLPASNVVSMIFLDRNARQMADAAGLLRGIHAEMDWVRRRHLGLTFIWGLRRSSCTAGRTGRTRPERPVRSDVRAIESGPGPGRLAAAEAKGKIAAGNLLLEGLDFFPPVREGTAASVGLVFYRGELHVCLRYDSRRLTVGQADDLLATYLRTIRAVNGRLCRHIQRPRSVKLKEKVSSWNASPKC